MAAVCVCEGPALWHVYSPSPSLSLTVLWRLSQQQNVMHDFVMTATYHRAILQNHTGLRNKIILASGYSCQTILRSLIKNWTQNSALTIYLMEGMKSRYGNNHLYMNDHNSTVHISQKVGEFQMPIN